jgi:hypothetical protein
MNSKSFAAKPAKSNSIVSLKKKAISCARCITNPPLNSLAKKNRDSAPWSNNTGGAKKPETHESSASLKIRKRSGLLHQKHT